MVLRCSLLGHDYGESIVEHEREERGSEVIVTVREYEQCSRCKTKHIISENTEVTSLATQTDADSHPDESESERTEPIDATESAETASDASQTTPADAETATEDAEFIDADADAGDQPTATPADSSPTPAESTIEPDVPTDENGEPITDDGEILTDEPADTGTERGHGEWPDSDDVGRPIGADATPAEWPDDGPDNDGDDSDDSDNDTGEWPDTEETELIDDDAVLLDSGATVESDTATNGLGAEPPNTESTDATSESIDTTPDSGSGIERAATAPSPTEGMVSRDDRGRTELYCPRCEFVAGSDRSSLRTGDICPECHRGYLSANGR